MDTLTITVLDTATIFEGPESIFRYDLPGSGVVEGWALAGVIDQALKSAGPAWPQLEVAVVADSTGSDISEEAVAIIVRHLRMEGVIEVRTPGRPEPGQRSAPARPASAPAEPDDAASAPPADTDSFAAVAPARDKSRGIRRRGGQGSAGWLAGLSLNPYLLTGAVAVVAVFALGLWTVIKPEPVPARPAAAASATPQASGVQGATLPSTSGSAPVPEHNPQRVEALGMELDLPPGFRWVEEDGLVTATGADPDLRVLLTADPLYSVPAEALLEEVRRHVEEDPLLSQPTEEGGRLRYLEDPGDGSRVAWSTWVEAGHQLSLGCHSRGEPTVAHKAACRMAEESLRFKAAPGA